MAAPTINFAGFVYDDSGDAVSGATIHIYDKNTTTTAREASSVTTNSSGYYSYSHATPGEFDVEIVKGTSKRRYKFDDKIHLSEIDVEKLSIRGNEGAIAALYLYADEGDDASDQWRIDAGIDGVIAIGNDINSQGTFVDHLTITPNSTASSSTVAIIGNATVGGALTVTGTTTLNGNLVLGDAAADTLTIGATLQGASPLVFEGATSGDFETTFAITDPTADRTITFPDLSGTVQLSGNPISGTTGTFSGILKTDDATDATSTTDGSLQTDGGLSVVKDAVFGDDVKLLSDSAVLSFGGDSDTTLTHTDGTGLTLNSTNKLTFGDTGTFIHQSSDGVLTIESDTTVDINGAVAFDGALTGITALTVDDVVVDGKVITMTGSASDTAVFTAGTNGTLSIVTTDAAAAAANIQITADGTVDIDSAGVLTLDSGAAINLEPASGSAVLIDGTVSIDGGAITGVASILEADVKIGEDDQTKIDFETADEIHFYAGNENQLTLTDGALTPSSNAIVDLGTDALEFKDAYFDGTLEADAITIGGTNIVSGSLITTLGTISAGTWQGTAIASAYLDSDTAHLSGTQTFSGAKTFSSTVDITGELTVGVDGTGHDVIFYGDTSGKKITWDQSEDELLITNETPIFLGTDKDIAIVHRATALSADAAWSLNSAVIEGTDDHPGVAANSLIVSNITNDGDIMFAVSDAGNSIGALKLKGADGSVNVHKDLIVNSSLQVATIDYTDGDLAMTIADGGAVTMNKSASGASYTYLDGNAGQNTRLIFQEDGTAKWNFGTIGSDDSFSIYNQTTSNSLLTFTAADVVSISGKLGVGTTSPDYDFEVEGAGAEIFAHYSGNSRGGIKALSSSRLSIMTTAAADDIVFGYADSAPADDGSDFTERMRIDNGTGAVTTEGSLQIKGTTPTLTIGDAGTEDTALIFDGNEVDFHIGLDDSHDQLRIGTGSTVGSGTIFTIDADNTYIDTHVKPAGDAGHSLGSSSFGWANLYLTDTGASADEGPTIQMRSKSASPADGDKFGDIKWIARNTAGIDHDYVTIQARTDDVTESTEDGRLDFNVYLNGTSYLVAGLWNNDLHLLRNLEMSHEGSAQDSQIWWDGNEVDFHIGLDDSANELTFGTGTALGSNNAFRISSTPETIFNANTVMLDDYGIKWGNAPDYLMYYSSTNTRWAMGSYNADGSGADEDLIRIEDGQRSIDANTTWDANVFDIYDDAMLLASSISPTADAYDFGKGVFKRGREALIEVGILKEYEDGWVGYNDQRMAALLAGGIYQTRQIVDEMKEEINKLRKQVTALGG